VAEEDKTDELMWLCVCVCVCVWGGGGGGGGGGGVSVTPIKKKCTIAVQLTKKYVEETVELVQ